MNCQEYNQEAVREKIQHAVSVLIETEAVRKVGGFDEQLADLGGLGFLYQAGCERLLRGASAGAVTGLPDRLPGPGG
jgi:hypothetical protein